MALPNQLNASVPAGSDLPSTLDNRIRGIAQAIEDIFGVPDVTNISNALFGIAAGGLQSANFQNAAVFPATAGHLVRNGASLNFHDGTTSRGIIFDSATQTLTNKTLTNPVATSPNVTGGQFAGAPIVVSPNIRGDVTWDILNIVQDFRLSYSSNVSVPTNNIQSANIVYATPHVGNRIGLYTGGTNPGWIALSSNQFSLALTTTAGNVYDVWAYNNSGTPALETLVWTNTTTRATALTTQDGILVKAGDSTRRYMGSLYSHATNLSHDSGTPAYRYLWNYYHRVTRPMERRESTDSWVYTTAAYRVANAHSNNLLDYVQGVSEEPVFAQVVAGFTSDQASGTISAAVGIGVDATATNSGLNSPIANAGGAQFSEPTATYRGYPGIGRHNIVWLEQSTATGNTTWYGDNGGVNFQSGITGEIRG